MKKSKKPFFAKFLEKQVKDEELKNAKGGAKGGTTSKSKDDLSNWPTMKYPSDNDEYHDWPTW